VASTLRIHSYCCVIHEANYSVYLRIYLNRNLKNMFCLPLSSEEGTMTADALRMSQSTALENVTRCAAKSKDFRSTPTFLKFKLDNFK
jgi:hypothetical protein